MLQRFPASDGSSTLGLAFSTISLRLVGLLGNTNLTGRGVGMDINTGMIAAGLAVGLLVGLTGMGAGSLMTPILITVFGIPPTTAVGSDLIYAAITKMFGAARHHQLKSVNTELGLWMGAGSVPAAILGVFTLYEIFPRI